MLINKDIIEISIEGENESLKLELRMIINITCSGFEASCK